MSGLSIFLVVLIILVLGWLLISELLLTRKISRMIGEDASSDSSSTGEGDAFSPSERIGYKVIFRVVSIAMVLMVCALFIIGAKSSSELDESKRIREESETKVAKAETEAETKVAEAEGYYGELLKAGIRPAIEKIHEIRLRNPESENAFLAEVHLKATMAEIDSAISPPSPRNHPPYDDFVVHEWRAESYIDGSKSEHAWEITARPTDMSKESWDYLFCLDVGGVESIKPDQFGVKVYATPAGENRFGKLKEEDEVKIEIFPAGTGGNLYWLLIHVFKKDLNSDGHTTIHIRPNRKVEYPMDYSLFYEDLYQIKYKVKKLIVAYHFSHVPLSTFEPLVTHGEKGLKIDIDTIKRSATGEFKERKDNGKIIPGFSPKGSKAVYHLRAEVDNPSLPPFLVVRQDLLKLGMAKPR